MTDNLIMGRKEHAARINEAWQKTVDGVIETGLRIHDARHGPDRLDHGQFEKMLTEDLHFSAPTGRRLMAIASNKVLSNRTHVNALPASWGTLYELSVVANKGVDLEAKIQSGDIHPRMERKEVKALLPPPQRYDDLEETDHGDKDFGPRGEALPTRVMIHDDGGRLRPASAEETATTFAVANAIANPIANAWESADERERCDFVRLYRTDLTEALEFGLKLAMQRELRTEAAGPTDLDAADDGGNVPSEAATKKRGRPKGSKNKPKPLVEPTAAEVTDQAAVADVSVLPNNDGLGIPEFLRRTPAAS